jgi:hypothetical protein
MTRDFPDLDSLLHHLAECPPAFLQVEAEQSAERIDVAAIVCDLLRARQPEDPPELKRELLEALRGRNSAEQALIAILCWLLSHEWFAARPQLAAAIPGLLLSDPVLGLAALVRPERFVNDADRREELARLCLARLELRPSGETAAQAADRLTMLDSAERQRVLRATAAAERRAREIREAMARRRAQDAASRYGE